MQRRARGELSAGGLLDGSPTLPRQAPQLPGLPAPPNTGGKTLQEPPQGRA